MGILDRVFEQRSVPPGTNSASDFWFTPIGDYSQSKSGIYVDRGTAMRCAAVYACVKVLAESISSLPIHMYERLPGGGRQRAREHWAYKLMHDQTGPMTPARQWVESTMFHLALVGNHYSVMDLMNSGEVRQLVPLSPQYVNIEVSDRGQYTYVYRPPDGKTYAYPWASILHIPALVWDGVQGISPISYAREPIGLYVAAEEFGSRFYANGTNVGTIYTLPEGVRKNQEELDKFLDDLRAKHASLSKSHGAMAVPAGMTVTKVGIPPDDAQFLETRKFQKAEIASIFRVPLHLIQEHEKSTTWGTGIESINQAFVDYTLRPWLVRIEQVLNFKLLSGAERERYYFEFLVDGLLRGDQKARSEFYTAMVNIKAMTPNEVREKENMNPAEWGDEPVEAANIFGGANNKEQPPEEKKFAPQPTRQLASGGVICDCADHRAEPDPELDHPRMSIQRSYRRVIRDAMARVIRRERNDIMAKAEKTLRKKLRKGETRDTGALAELIAEFYTAHEEFTREAIRPAFTALAEAIGAEAMREIQQKWAWSEELEQWLEEYITAFAARHSDQSRGQLLQLLDELEEEQGAEVDETAVLDGLGQRFEEWEIGLDGGKPRDDKIGARESIRLGNGFAAAAFFAAGVAALVWRATGSETCPYCMSLNGRTVGQGEWFLTAGEDFAPGDAEPLRPHSNISHPPAHSGCDCLLIPGG